MLFWDTEKRCDIIDIRDEHSTLLIISTVVQ